MFFRSNKKELDALKAENVNLKLELLEALQKAKTAQHREFTKGDVLRDQLGSFIPDFKFLEDKGDADKERYQILCFTLFENPEFLYLLDHLKQSQVHKYIFEGGVSDDFMRGTVNGVYLVQELINLLGNAQKNRQNTK